MLRPRHHDASSPQARPRSGRGPGQAGESRARRRPGGNQRPWTLTQRRLRPDRRTTTSPASWAA